MSATGETLADRLGALASALREAADRNRVGTIKSMDVLLKCHGPGLEPTIDLMLKLADSMFGSERHQVRRVGNDPQVLLLGSWAQGQLATISAGRAEGREHVDIVVLGTKGSLAHRWTGGDDEAL